VTGHASRRGNTCIRVRRPSVEYHTRVAIREYEFEFAEGLSTLAQCDLVRAVEQINQMIESCAGGEPHAAKESSR